MNGLPPALARGSVAACCVLLFAWPTASAARQAGSQPPASQPPASAVVVDVSVTDRNGGPVPGLGPADFVVTVDGQPREVISARQVGPAVSAGAAGIASRPAVPSAGVAPVRTVPYSSNEHAAAGRLVLVAVDEGSVSASGLRRVSGPLAALLGGLGPADRVGLAALPSARMVVGFTHDRERVIDGLGTMGGSGAWSGAASGYRLSVLEAYAVSRGDARVSDGVVRRECALFTSDLDQARCPDAVRAEARRLVAEAGGRVRQLGDGVGRLIAGIGRLGAPATMVLISEGVASPEAASSLQALGPVVSAAEASIHVLRPASGAVEFERGVPLTADDRTAASASLETLAGIGGGAVYDVAGSAESPVRRLASVLASSYLVAFEAGAPDRDGRPHRIEISSRRTDVAVQSRPTLVVRPEPGGGADRLSAVLRSPVPASELAIRVRTFNLADDTPGQVRVLVAGEVDHEQVAPGPALVGFALLDAAGQVAASHGQQVTLLPTPAGRLAYTGGVSVPSGRYTLRFAAVRRGRAGSVERQVEARLTTAASLRVGDLVLGEPPPPGGAIVPPVDGRLRGDRLVGYLQVGHEPGARDDLVLDIVKREDGPALLSVPFSLTPSKARATAVQVSLDVSLLPPGEYGARVSVPGAGATAVEGYAPFSLDRMPRDRRGVAGDTVGGAGGVGEGGGAEARTATPPERRPPDPPVRPVSFPVSKVLDPEVLDPFLDDLRERAPAGTLEAIEQARGGGFREALGSLPAGRGADPVAPFLRGLAWLSENRLQEASDAFRDAIRAAPDFLVGAFYLGACYAAGGRTTQAINAWQTSLIGLDRFPSVYRVLGETLLDAGDPNRALSVLRRGAERWPNDAALNERAIRAAFEARHFALAMELADRLADVSQVDPGVLFIGMQATFEAAFAADGSVGEGLAERIRRLRDRYVAVGGPRQALVAEWVAFVEARARGPLGPGGRSARHPRSHPGGGRVGAVAEAGAPRLVTGGGSGSTCRALRTSSGRGARVSDSARVLVVDTPAAWV